MASLSASASHLTDTASEDGLSQTNTGETALSSTHATTSATAVGGAVNDVVSEASSKAVGGAVNDVVSKDSANAVSGAVNDVVSEAPAKAVDGAVNDADPQASGTVGNSANQNLWNSPACDDCS